MKVKLLLTTSLLLILSTLVSCQMLKNRKPQSAGSNALCSDCLMEKLDEDIEKIKNAMEKAKPKAYLWLKRLSPFDLPLCLIKMANLSAVQIY